MIEYHEISLAEITATDLYYGIHLYLQQEAAQLSVSSLGSVSKIHKVLQESI